MPDSSKSREIVVICQDYRFALDKILSTDVDPSQSAMRLTEMAADMRARRRIFGFLGRFF